MNLGFIKKTIMAFVVSIFLGMSVFLFFRKFDGSGAENTADVKLISLAIWLGFYLLVLANIRGFTALIIAMAVVTVITYVVAKFKIFKNS